MLVCRNCGCDFNGGIPSWDRRLPDRCYYCGHWHTGRKVWGAPQFLITP